MSGGHGGGHGRGHGRRGGGHDEEHEEHENHERWLVSYADMMTLLMVLFIVMFAISQVDKRKFAALELGLAAAFGTPVAMMNGSHEMLDPGGAVAPDTLNLPGQVTDKASKNDGSTMLPSTQQVASLVMATTQASVAQEVARLEQAQAQLQTALNKAKLSNAATFRIDERGLVVSIATDDVLFPSGSAVLQQRGRGILDALAPTLAALPNRISVDGHTNSVPISTARYPSNWELSADRATGVLRYLTGVIPATKMSASAFADTKPLRPGKDATALRVNRRVEIVVLARLDDASARAMAKLANAGAPATP